MKEIKMKANLISWIHEFNQILVRTRSEADILFHGVRFKFTEESGDEPTTDDPKMFKRFVTITVLEESDEEEDEFENIKADSRVEEQIKLANRLIQDVKDFTGVGRKRFLRKLVDSCHEIAWSKTAVASAENDANKN